jgi:hypothetical protein
MMGLGMRGSRYVGPAITPGRPPCDGEPDRVVGVTYLRGMRPAVKSCTCKRIGAWE